MQKPREGLALHERPRHPTSGEISRSLAGTSHIAPAHPDRPRFGRRFAWVDQVVGLPVVLVAAVATGCGSHHGMPDTAPDASADTSPEAGTKITIRTYPDLGPYTGRTANAMLVALQDGDDPWRALTGVGGFYSATVTSQQYSVAVGCASNDSVYIISNVYVFYQAVSDNPDIRAAGCPSDPVPTVHISIDLQGIPAGQQGEVLVGDRPAAQNQANGPFEANVPKGVPVDVFASSVTDPNAPIASELYRGPTLDAQADQQLAIDLQLSALPPERDALTLIGADASEFVEVSSYYSTASSHGDWFLGRLEPDSGPPASYITVPAAAGRQPNDVTEIFVDAAQHGADNRNYQRDVGLVTKALGPQTVELPAAWTLDSPTLDRAGVPRATMTFPSTPATLRTADYSVGFLTSMVSSTAVEQHYWNLSVGASLAASHPSVTVTMPDLSALPGWQADMELASGVAVQWVATRSDRNLAPDLGAVDGLLILTSSVNATLAP